MKPAAAAKAAHPARAARPPRTRAPQAQARACGARPPGRRATPPSTRPRPGRARPSRRFRAAPGRPSARPENAEDIKQKVRDLHAALSQIKGCRKNLAKTFFDIGLVLKDIQTRAPLRGQAVPVVRVLRRARDRPRQDHVAAPGARRRALPAGRRARGRHGPRSSPPSRPSTRPASPRSRASRRRPCRRPRCRCVRRAARPSHDPRPPPLDRRICV